jgi:5-(carboxyamino)imidazole ribonucleotide synthase
MAIFVDMLTTEVNRKKIAILGGGQLGRMLIEETSRYDLAISVLDPSEKAPSAEIATQFTKGDFKETVLDFCEPADVVTIEIEHVNIEALKELERKGKSVYPQPSVLEIVKDKGLQKQFYLDKGIPTAPFRLADGDLNSHMDFIPFMQKSRTGGYDGKGVHPVRTSADLNSALSGPCVLEKWVPFEKELAVIVARNANGEMAVFPSVEMEFNQEANLVSLLFSPASIEDAIHQEATRIARKVAEELGVVGLLAVEMFITAEGSVLVNEVAPRPHNSGHHTIECCYTSQYEQHMRAILNWPLGDTQLIEPAVMINLLGEKGQSGNAQYEGLNEALSIKGVYVHLYGKEQTAPFRKMGHITVMNPSVDEAKNIARSLAKKVKVVAVDNLK